MSFDKDNDIEEAPNESLGLRLRTAREEKGLTVESVAHQLNLSLQRVRDMENDEYRFASAETYAKGYLRSYAKLLGLDPDEVIRDFDRLHYTDTIEHHKTKFIRNRQITASDRWMRWVTYSIGLVLIFLVAIWWRSTPNRLDADPVIAETAEPSTAEISAQATKKTEGQERQSIPLLGEGTGVLQKPELSSTGLGQISDQDPSQKPLADLSSTQDSTQKSTLTIPSAETEKAPTSAADSNKPADKNSSSPKTVVQPPVAGQTAAKAADKKPAADDSSDESDDDSDTEEDDSQAAKSTDKKQSWNNPQGTSQKLILGQREQDERALLQDLEKVFGRG